MRHLIPFLLLLPLLAAAQTVELKDVNGRTGAFQIESIVASGIHATPVGKHRKFLIPWEQLDLEWIEQHQPQIWQQKQAIEQSFSAAFTGFTFRDSRASIMQKIGATDAIGVSGEPFNDHDPQAVWIAPNPKDFSRFIRFAFTPNGLLSEIQVHQNFPSRKPIESDLKREWDRLCGMVESFNINARQSRHFPNSMEWRRFKTQANTSPDSRLLTHHWEDEHRRIDLALASRSIDVRGPSVLTGEKTVFGVEVKASVSVPKENTHWLIYTARLK